MRRIGPGIALALGACSSRHASTADGATDTVGAPITVTGRDVVDAVSCTDASHVPSVAEQPFVSLSATVTLADGTSALVPVAADGTFSFTASAGAPYRLMLSSNLGVPVEYELSAPTLDLVSRLAGRYDRTPAPANTMVAGQIAGSVPGSGTAIVASIGQWDEVARTTGDNHGFTVPWTQPSSLSGPIGLLDASKFDRAYYTIHDLVGNPQYTAITTACSADITMTGASATMLACTAAPVTADHCTHVSSQVMAEATRLANAVPASYTLPAWSWGVFAIPAPALGPIAPLALAHVDGTGTPQADADTDLMYGVPYPGHAVTAIVTLRIGRAIALGTALPAYVYAISQHAAAAAADCTTPTEVDPTTAIPTQPALDGVGLTSDNVGVSIDRTQPHALSWDVAAPGTADYWVARLYEVTAANNQTQVTLRHSWITPGTTVHVTPDLLQTSSTYLFEVEAISELPNAATGDFRTISYPGKPTAAGAVQSGTFVIND